MTARDLALIELDQRRLPGWKPLAMRPRRQDPPTDPRDLALAERILVGVIQNHLRLQQLTEHYSGRKLKSIDPLVQKIISVGLYQLRFLERIPTSAAVNEAVEQARRFGRAKAAGFVNAVLRKATREPNPPLPDREADPARYAQIALSHPRELFERLAKLIGASDALRFCEHDNREPPTILRVTRVTPSPGTESLVIPGVTLTPHERPGMFVVEGAKRPLLAEWARRGIAQVQDPTAASVAEACRLEIGQIVLDRCAGLGTKTLQLREAVGDSGLVIAMDPAVDRSRALRALLAERGISNVKVYEAGQLRAIPDLATMQFDRVLVDVPCSNSGVLPRRPEARYAQTLAGLRSLARLQSEILDDTASHVRPGGLLIYSTCSIWPQENNELITAFLKRRNDFVLLQDRTTLPSLELDIAKYHDGGYWSVLRRPTPPAGPAR